MRRSDTQPGRCRRPRWAVLALLLLLPTQMGGCPEFRNEVLNITNTAVKGLVFGELVESEAVDTVGRGIVTAAIDLFFDTLRDDRAG